MSQSHSFTKFRPSSVDESLFGARRITREEERPCKEFDPPWVKENGNGQQTRPLLFYCPSTVTSNMQDMVPKDQKTNYQNQNQHSKTPQQNIQQKSTAKKNVWSKFSPSFVDESLFGSPRDNSTDDATSFDPPWVKQREKAPRPILFDYSGHRSSTCQTDRSNQSSGISRTKSRQKTIEAKKPWR